MTIVIVSAALAQKPSARIPIAGLFGACNKPLVWISFADNSRLIVQIGPTCFDHRAPGGGGVWGATKFTMIDLVGRPVGTLTEPTEEGLTRILHLADGHLWLKEKNYIKFLDVNLRVLATYSCQGRSCIAELPPSLEELRRTASYALEKICVKEVVQVCHIFHNEVEVDLTTLEKQAAAGALLTSPEVGLSADKVLVRPDEVWFFNSKYLLFELKDNGRPVPLDTTWQPRFVEKCEPSVLPPDSPRELVQCSSSFPLGHDDGIPLGGRAAVFDVAKHRIVWQRKGEYDVPYFLSPDGHSIARVEDNSKFIELWEVP